jgi:hypothetical protein
MGATSDNYLINTDGITYTISSDYVNNAHHQLVKIVTGTGDKVQYINSDTPLSAGLCGSWDRYEYLSSPFYSIATTIVGYTGNGIPVVGVCGAESVNVSVVGSVAITGEDIDVRVLNGGTVGAQHASMAGIDYVSIQGICGGYPVGMTFTGNLPITINSLADHAVYGVSGGTAIGVTFGVVNFRGITAATDTITVYGGGTASTVSVGLFGLTGASMEALFSEGNALNVNVKSFAVGIDGITISGGTLAVRNLSSSSDSILVVGQGSSDNASTPRATVPTYINALSINGNLMQVGGITGSGWSAAALNVNMVNSGITFSVSASATFGTTLGVTSASNAALFVQGTTYASTGVWVAGGTNGEPVQIKGFSAGFLPVELNNFTTQTNAINSNLADIRTFTQFLIATKKALYSDTQSVGALDFSDSASLYTLLRDNLGSSLQSLKDSVMPNSTLSTLVESSQKSMAVSVVATKQQPSFLSRTNFAGLNAKNLNEFNGGSGYTCASGVRIKASRVATGASASSNEFMCIISEADAALYGATAGNYAYTLYHGEEIFVEIDNINKLRVFYPAYSASFAPHNTGAGVTFSFYAS